LEPIYRYAKVAKADRGDLDSAGEFYYLERKEHYAAARENADWRSWPWSKKSKFLTISEWLIGQFVLGYGEKPMRPLLWAAGTIFLFAVLYWLAGAVVPQAASVWDNLYFSVVTFTTLGYGDLRPAQGLPRALAAIEALIGVTLMSLFLVTLARRFIR
jgi:hypothetical protein